MKKIKILAFLLAMLMTVLAVASCNTNQDSGMEPETETVYEGSSVKDNLKVRTINGIPLEEYTIVYNPGDVDYSERAAEYIRDQIKSRTSVELDVKMDIEGNFAHEIIVGETWRDISFEIDVDTKKSQFVIFADDNHIVLEGDYFLIAAAAYFFVDTYIPGEYFDSQIPKEIRIHEPIAKEAKNFILMIGDGMGIYQTLLFDSMDVAKSGVRAYSDGEDIFYGYFLSNYGMSRTKSLSGVTDSAAGGTALATGYKTKNSFVGKDKDKNDIQSLTELAASLGKATAVMSTEVSTGATPASFSAHVLDRTYTSEITASQNETKNKYGTIIDCGYDYYDKTGVSEIEKRVTNTLNQLSQNENGFFLMYEEAYIDKHCHNKNISDTFDALVRFNQVIGLVMEYAFYNPKTMVVITADHETGNLLPNGKGDFSYSSGDHSAQYVPVFSYGIGSEFFDQRVVENIEIPKEIARLWGVDKFGQ